MSAGQTVIFLPHVSKEGGVVGGGGVVVVVVAAVAVVVVVVVMVVVAAAAAGDSIFSLGTTNYLRTDFRDVTNVDMLTCNG
jgi:hypothetical protein